MECARVYKLNSTNGLVYYGSTTKKVLTKRLVEHKSDARRTLKKCSSYLLFTEGDTVTITLVENVENCKDKYKLRARERWYIENNDCVNKQIPNRSAEDWRKYYKDWHAANREQINEHCREYYEVNKERIKENCREYYEENKERIKAYAREKVTCECGDTVSRGGIATHRKTQNHKNKMLKLNKDVVATDDAGSVSPPFNIY